MPAWQGGCRICHERRRQRPSEKVRQMEGSVSPNSGKLKEYEEIFVLIKLLLLLSILKGVHMWTVSLPSRVRAQSAARLSPGSSSKKELLWERMSVWSGARMCDFMCGWMYMCFIKKKVPVILVCGSPQLTLSCVLYWSHKALREQGGKVCVRKKMSMNKAKTDQTECAEEMKSRWSRREFLIRTYLKYEIIFKNL